MAKATAGPGQLERCFRILDLLHKYAIHGLRNKDIAAATGYSAVQVSRDLDALQEVGEVKEREKGFFAPHHYGNMGRVLRSSR